MRKRIISIILMGAMLLLFTSCKADSGDKEKTVSSDTTMSLISTSTTSLETTQDVSLDLLPYQDSSLSTAERVSDLLSRMTLEEKAGQMVQGVIGDVTESEMTSLYLGSVLSGGGAYPGDNSIDAWQDLISHYQEGALATPLSIPFIYGIDAVHGDSNVYGAVIFPQNIGLGAANDPTLMYAMGAAVAEEMKLTGTLWNFSPCVAVSQDPRWGRVYESYSSDPALVSELALAYMDGQQDHGILCTAKHYAGDGGAEYGTGEGQNLIDRGDVTVSAEAFSELFLSPYKVLVDNGVQCIMVSFSSYNGVKMTESEYYLTEVLKGEYGFDGFLVTDWEATDGMSGADFEDNVILAANAGIDMFMEPYRYEETCEAIIDGVETGAISVDRVDDAVSRILTVKFDMGLFEDPYQENLTHDVTELGSDSVRAIAKQLVSESLVLLKNEEDILPLKAGSKIYVLGPAIDDIGVQCGGWTMSWQGLTDVENGGEITPGTTILEGLQEYAAEYGLEIITDPARAEEADVVILAVGEQPYAEFEGDVEDISLTSEVALSGNTSAIEEAEALNKPIVTLLVAGRQIEIEDYMDSWDAIVMCYLPGTQGDGIASVLTGEADFTGTLPMPWYASTSEIGSESPSLTFDIGYGLKYS